MTEADNLVLEHLRALRSDPGSIRQDVRDIKSRITIVESGIAGLRRDVGDLGMSLTGQQVGHTGPSSASNASSADST